MTTHPSASNQLNERQQYGLERLAEHLKQAQQHDRLRLLFAGDEWMRMRVSCSNFMYSGFVNDLEIAWAAFGEADKSARGRVTALSDYVRLGLIASSVTSLSTRPLNLLVNAVATGCWVPARVLAIAAINPSVVERVVIYTGLLMIEDLDADARDQIQRLVCRTVAEAPDTIPMRFLARLLPCLKGTAFQVILEQLMRKLVSMPLVPATQGWLSVQFTGEDQQIYINEVISLLEYVPAERRVPVLERIAAAVSDSARRVAAKAEQPEEEEGAVNNLLNAVVRQTLRSMRREGDNLEVLGRQLQEIAPYVRESKPVDSILAHIVNALESTTDPVFHRVVVSEYASLLHDELLDRVVAKMIELSSTPVLPEILTALAPHLDAGHLANVSETVAAFGDERQRALATEALARGRNAVTLTAQTGVREQAGAVSGVNSLDGCVLSQVSSSPRPTPLFEHAEQPDRDVLEQIFRLGGDNVIRGAERLDLRVGSLKPSLPARDAHAKGTPVPTQRSEEVLSRLIASTFPNIDLQEMALAANRPTAQDEGSAATAELQPDSYISRLYAQGKLLLYAPYLSDAELCAAAEFADPSEAAKQLEMLDQVVSRLSEAVESEERCSEGIAVDEVADSARRVKGAIVRGALKLAYQGTPKLIDPWQTFPRAALSNADLSPVLEYVLTLPVEVERNLFVWTMNRRAADKHTRCLLLKGLEPLIPYLDPPLIQRALAHINALTNVTVRDQALNLIAPYLTGAQLEQVLGYQVGGDAQELAQLLASLAALTPEGERASVHAWVLAAALEGADGELLGELLGDLLVGTDRATQGSLLEQALAHIMGRQPNDRFDALIQLVGKWPDPLPRQLLDAVLRLPEESERGTFTWRGYAITSLMKRFPDDMLPGVWEAIQALPPYLHIGEPGATGWHWSYSYPYAAALHALAPRVTGALLEEVFTAACSLYWKPREEILQQMVEKTPSELAGRVLDHTLAMLEEYSSADLSANTLWRDEMALYTGSIDLFRAERQVAAAELIAGLAPRLSAEDLTKVLQSPHLFTNTGPRAWLPGKLLPYLDEEQQRQILPVAVIAAFEFVADDPTRFDLLTALLPALRSAMEKEVAQIRELTRKYFPARDEIFITTKEDFNILSSEDLVSYKQLTAKYFTPEIREAMRSLNEASSDNDRRLLMEQAVLTPLFSTSVEQLALSILTSSPLLQRVKALPTLSQELKPDQFATLLDQTFAELQPLLRQNIDDIDELIDSLIGSLSHIPANLHQTLLEIALSLEPPDLLPDEELEVEIYGHLLKELPERPPVPTDERPQDLLPGLLTHQFKSEKLRGVFDHLLGNRERLLAALLPHLNPSLTAQLVSAVLLLPEAQRVGALFMLMGDLNSEHRAQVHGNILAMRSAFGRTWLLWHLREYFSDEQSRTAIAAALEAVRDLRTPEGQVVALFGLLGLADGETRRWMFEWILDTLGRIEEASDRLHVLSLFIAMAEGQPGLQARAVEILLQPQDVEWRAQQLMIFSKALESHGNLGQELFTRARTLLIQELHDSAKFERGSYLRGLRNLCPAFKLLTRADEIYLIASSSREISTGWNWL